jgi:hypothetical protein
MTVDREEASALLGDVEGIEERVRQLLVYARVSDYLFLWGAIWVIGFTCNYFLRDHAALLWDGLQVVGLAGTLGIVALHRRRTGNKNMLISVRAALSVLAIIAFGALWLSLVPVGWREQVTFWPLLLSLLLFQLGLWLGRAIALAAVAIFAVSLLGYYVAGPYLHLWMAGATGGATIAGGFWLRR